MLAHREVNLHASSRCTRSADRNLSLTDTSSTFSSEVLAEYRNRSLPLTVVVLDMDWHTPGWSEDLAASNHLELLNCTACTIRWLTKLNSLTSPPHATPSPTRTCMLARPPDHYTWDPKLFPDHTQFVAALRSGSNAYGKPLKLAMNIHPGAYQITTENEANYVAFARAMGVNPNANTSFGCNLYDKTYATALMTTVLDPTGMDFYWDDCYACTWKVGGVSGQDGGSCGDGISVNVESNLWSQYVFNTYHRNNETVASGGKGRGRRTMTLNRLPGVSPSNAVYTLLQNPTLTETAALAGHRYPVAWTGDIEGDFPTLAAHVALFAQAAGTMLYTHYSADLGGFRSTYPEQYVRWLQWACFVGVFRTHGSHEKRIWLYSTYEQLADAMRLRGAMMPWLYTLAHRVHALSEPFLRPMWFEHPELNPFGARRGGEVACGTGTGNDTHVGHDASGASQRSPTHPIGLLVKNRAECCGTCATDPLCAAYIFADSGPVPGSGCDSCNCWPMESVAGLEPKSGRTVGGEVGAEAYALDSQFYFDDAIVRPITWGVGADNTTQVTTWLPTGSWSRWDGGSQHTVPPRSAQNVTETFQLGEIPVYVPTGKLFPFATDASTGAIFSDPLIWVAVAPTGTGAAAVYEDDGETEAYATSTATGAPSPAQAWTNATYAAANETALVLRIGPTVGGSEIGLPASRSHWFQVRGSPAERVAGFACNGVPLVGPAALAASGSWWRCSVGGASGGVPSSLACPDGAVVGACSPLPSAEAVTVTATIK